MIVEILAGLNWRHWDLDKILWWTTFILQSGFNLGGFQISALRTPRSSQESEIFACPPPPFPPEHSRPWTRAMFMCVNMAKEHPPLVVERSGPAIEDGVRVRNQISSLSRSDVLNLSPIFVWF